MQFVAQTKITLCHWLFFFSGEMFVAQTVYCLDSHDQKEKATFCVHPPPQKKTGIRPKLTKRVGIEIQVGPVNLNMDTPKSCTSQSPGKMTHRSLMFCSAHLCKSEFTFFRLKSFHLVFFWVKRDAPVHANSSTEFSRNPFGMGFYKAVIAVFILIPMYPRNLPLLPTNQWHVIAQNHTASTLTQRPCFRQTLNTHLINTTHIHLLPT